MPSAPVPPPPSGPNRAGRRPLPGPDPEPNPSPSPPISRRSILGLGVAAGAGAGALVAGGIAGFSSSDSDTVVDADGAPVVQTSAQRLSTTQQQQALKNLGAVRTVEPEQFPGGTDDAQLTAAVQALGTAGGVVRLRPGKVYTWHDAIAPIDWSKQGALVITGWGAIVNYNGAGPAFTSVQSATQAGTRTLTVLGGEWVAPQADAFFAIIDSGNHLFYRCRGQVPNGAFFHLSNRKFWSERNHFVEIEDHECREVIRFTLDGSPHESFARTLVKDLRLQGGTAGYPKINVVTTDGAKLQPAPYDSTFDGIVGNIGDGVIIQRLAGGMSGTTIGRIQVESPQSSTTAAVWQVGDLDGKPPLLPDGPPILRNLIMFTADSLTQSPFGPSAALGGLKVGAALSTTPFVTAVKVPGPVTVPGDECNLAIIELNADCTGTEIDLSLTDDATQVLTLVFQQNAAGGHAYRWPTNSRFALGQPPTTTTPMTQSSVTFGYQRGVWVETGRAEGVPYS